MKSYLLLNGQCLVKRRAHFRCENCENTEKLISHHIKSREYDGKNTLRNGRCLCRSCHPQYSPTHRNSRIRSRFIEELGWVEGNKYFEKYRASDAHAKKQIKKEVYQKDMENLERKFDKSLKENLDGLVNAVVDHSLLSWLRKVK